MTLKFDFASYTNGNRGILQRKSAGKRRRHRVRATQFSQPTLVLCSVRVDCFNMHSSHKMNATRIRLAKYIPLVFAYLFVVQCVYGHTLAVYCNYDDELVTHQHPKQMIRC